MKKTLFGLLALLLFVGVFGPAAQCGSTVPTTSPVKIREEDVSEMPEVIWLYLFENFVVPKNGPIDMDYFGWAEETSDGWEIKQSDAGLNGNYKVDRPYFVNNSLVVYIHDGKVAIGYRALGGLPAEYYQFEVTLTLLEEKNDVEGWLHFRIENHTGQTINIDQYLLVNDEEAMYPISFIEYVGNQTTFGVKKSSLWEPHTRRFVVRAASNGHWRPPLGIFTTRGAIEFKPGQVWQISITPKKG